MTQPLSTVIAMLTHDPKLDDSALNVASNSPAFYAGTLEVKRHMQNEWKGC